MKCLKWLLRNLWVPGNLTRRKAGGLLNARPLAPAALGNSARCVTRVRVLVTILAVEVSGASVALSSDLWTQERFANFPYKTSKDMDTVHMKTMSVLAKIGSVGNQPGFSRYLSQVQSFTSTTSRTDESFRIVDFAASSDPALVRLREDVGIHAPPGGAVVRLYKSVDIIPGAIRELFGRDVGGVTLWRRYIAIVTDEKADDEIHDTVSHELVHAFIASRLGVTGGELPTWFHEGAALYLSDAKPHYVSYTGPGSQRMSYSPRDYNDYRLAFRYLESAIGPKGVTNFIRRAVEGGSVEPALQAAVGVRDWEALRGKALDWWKRRQLYYALAVIGVVAAGALLVKLYTVRRNERTQRALGLLEEGLAMARAGLVRDALDNFAEARRLAPDSPDVRLGLQRAMDEVNSVLR